MRFSLILYFIFSFSLFKIAFQSVLRRLDFEEFQVIGEIVGSKAIFLPLLLYWVVVNSLFDMGPIGSKVFSWLWAWIKLKTLVSNPLRWTQMVAGSPGLRCLAREKPLEMESVRSHLAVVKYLFWIEWVGAHLHISETHWRARNNVALTAFIWRLVITTHSKLRRGFFINDRLGELADLGCAFDQRLG